MPADKGSEERPTCWLERWLAAAVIPAVSAIPKRPKRNQKAARRAMGFKLAILG